MATTAREIVQQTLDYAYPERVARSFYNSDLYRVSCTAKTRATEWQEVGNGRWERVDEWGNLWARIEATSKGEVVKGAIESLDELEYYEFPDYSRSEDYAVVKAARKEHPDKWLVGEVPGFSFNIARKMRKLEQYLMDLLLEKDRLHAFHDRIDQVLRTMITEYATAGVDGIFFPEDWGTQKQTLISPKLWYREFFPRFQTLCGLAHELGIKVFMHSCGQISAIVPGLIEAGIDVLQFDQPDLHGIATLAGYQQKNPITFWCPVDIQKTLQQRDETIIRTKAREMLDTLWQGRGGFIAGYYEDNVSLGLDPKWQAYACEEFIVWGQ